MATTAIIITKPGRNGRTLSSLLLDTQSLRRPGGVYIWSVAVDDGNPSRNRMDGWRAAPQREYATVWQALRAADAAGWSIQYRA